MAESKGKDKRAQIKPKSAEIKPKSAHIKREDKRPGLKPRRPAPHEMVADFDPGTWAAVHSLALVLVRKGVLGPADIAGLAAEMRALRDKHAAVGESQRADSVDIAAKDIALLAPSATE